MIDRNSNNENLVSRFQELEISLQIWMAANEAKSQRIEELEAERCHMQKRIARLNRQLGRRKQGESEKILNFAR